MIGAQTTLDNPSLRAYHVAHTTSNRERIPRCSASGGCNGAATEKLSGKNYLRLIFLKP